LELNGLKQMSLTALVAVMTVGLSGSVGVGMLMLNETHWPAYHRISDQTLMSDEIACSTRVNTAHPAAVSCGWAQHTTNVKHLEEAAAHPGHERVRLARHPLQRRHRLCAIVLS
jgi:hypothetical protein